MHAGRAGGATDPALADTSGDDPSSAEPLTLLTTPHFVDELHRRLAGARDRIVIQLMTFDGDDAGHAVADLLVTAARRGVEVRLLIDCFVEKGVSDTPVRRPEVQVEFAATNAMYDRLRSEGVAIAFTHPTGPLEVFTLVRNHKKLFIIDDTLYLGGINVSDHNFEWHDFMIRIEEPAIRDAVLADFDHTWSGGRQNLDRWIDTEAIGPVRLLTNDAVEPVFEQLMAEAVDEVVLASPYADDIGLCRSMRRCRARTRRVILSRHSNAILYRVLTPYVRYRLARIGVEIASYRNFSHSKFLLVDDRRLLVGSSNFGRHSFWCNQEICLLITDPGFIARFRAAMTADVEPFDDRPRSHEVAAGSIVAYGFHLGVHLLRATVARRVPPLSRR